MQSQKNEWLAVYIYASDPWEKLLTDAVKPFAEEVLNEGLAEQYFFIRYWEKGPHIRLRFKGDMARMQRELRPRIDAYFNDYLAHNPSPAEQPEWATDARKKGEWFPLDSIQYIEYEPETERYGGERALLVSEQQFQASSNAILAIMAESDGFDYSRALGSAIQMHLGFAHALGMDLQELSHFCDLVFRGWFPRAYSYTPETTAEEHKQMQTETMTLFEAQFEQQKEMLVPFHQTVWDAFQSDQEFEQEWLNTWIAEMKSVREKLENLQVENTIEFPPYFRYNKELPVEENKQWLWSLYESYVHMVNNRLGIFNRDEAYLGYLIKQSISAISSMDNVGV